MQANWQLQQANDAATSAERRQMSFPLRTQSGIVDVHTGYMNVFYAVPPFSHKPKPKSAKKDPSLPIDRLI